ncbi:hypothetical protein J4Q44_G00309460 [Coregonus suidteri]|uniref:Uncharacterized protein n=1 Tax=Coregonus suidteri TaxID=861788 RepID=A0AAN8QI55_9TELE
MSFTWSVTILTDCRNTAQNIALMLPQKHLDLKVNVLINYLGTGIMKDSELYSIWITETEGAISANMGTLPLNFNEALVLNFRDTD